MRASSTVWLSLVAIALAGCGSGESPAPVSSSPASQPAVALNGIPTTDSSAIPSDAPLDAALVTLELPGMV